MEDRIPSYVPVVIIISYYLIDIATRLTEHNIVIAETPPTFSLWRKSAFSELFTHHPALLSRISDIGSQK